MRLALSCSVTTSGQREKPLPSSFFLFIQTLFIRNWPQRKDTSKKMGRRRRFFIIMWIWQIAFAIPTFAYHIACSTINIQCWPYLEQLNGIADNGHQGEKCNFRSFAVHVHVLGQHNQEKRLGRIFHISVRPSIHLSIPHMYKSSLLAKGYFLAQYLADPVVGFVALPEYVQYTCMCECVCVCVPVNREVGKISAIAHIAVLALDSFDCLGDSSWVWVGSR